MTSGLDAALVSAKARGRRRPGRTGRPKVRAWTIGLPWLKPPLSLNDRMHYRTKAQWTRQIRTTAWAEALRHRVPVLARCSVQLWYAPRDRRVRDEDNLMATAKPLYDGLVDAGIVPDDGPAFMLKPSPRIVPPDGRPRLWLVVTELPACDISAEDFPRSVTS